MRPLISIWTNPVATFKYLGERNYEGKNNHIDLLIALITLSLLLANAKELLKLIDKDKSGMAVVVFAVTPLIGILFFQIYSFIVWKIAKMFEGKATFSEIQISLTYSLIPAFIIPALSLLRLVPAIQTGHLNLIFALDPINFFILWIFTTRNVILGLSYFNKYSYGYAILNIVMTAALFASIASLLKN